MNTGTLICTFLVMVFNTKLAVAQTNMSHDMNHTGSAMHRVNIPALPGQDAFGAIQEIVMILEADPNTDWSKVNLSALREHLLDMNLLALNAVVNEKELPDGLMMSVSGSGRSLQAIQRMVTAHQSFINGMNGWRVSVESTADGVKLTATASDAAQVKRIKGLGFFGLMVTGGHHQQHHLALARGGGMHSQ
jgi:hypothetical protein